MLVKQKLEVWKFIGGETDWVAAASRQDAIQFLAGYYGFTDTRQFLRESEYDAIVRLPRESILRIRDAADPRNPPTAKTIGQWLENADVAFLIASTAL